MLCFKIFASVNDEWTRIEFVMRHLKHFIRDRLRSQGQRSLQGEGYT